MKKTLKKISHKIIDKFTKLNFLNLLIDLIVERKLSNTTAINHNKISLNFHTPNRLCLSRAKTFSHKEPETLNWIDGFTEKSCFWDIGANIGIYSMYAAKKRGCCVVSFEPLSNNLDIFVRNINSNNLQNDITIMPLPLASQIGTSTMFDSMSTWGGSQASFDKNIGWDGKPIQYLHTHKTFGLSMDDAIEIFSVKKPDYIKIDVDGMEHFLLQGGKLAISYAKEILIEINDSFSDQADICSSILSGAGFFLSCKSHSDMFDGSSTYNQIWKK